MIYTLLQTILFLNKFNIFDLLMTSPDIYYRQYYQLSNIVQCSMFKQFCLVFLTLLNDDVNYWLDTFIDINISTFGLLRPFPYSLTSFHLLHIQSFIRSFFHHFIRSIHTWSSSSNLLCLPTMTISNAFDYFRLLFNHSSFEWDNHNYLLVTGYLFTSDNLHFFLIY